MKWETPARSAFSSRDPAPIQKPIATERTCASRSEMTRSPESSSLRTYFCTGGIVLGGASRLSPSSEGCPPPITVNGLGAAAFETALGFEHRLRTVPGRSPAPVEARILDHRPGANRDIEPWELHSELVLVCPEVRKRALELLPKTDPDAFLARVRELASPVVAGADAVALPPNLPVAIVGYALWRLAETVRSALVVAIAVVALALLAEILH